MNRVEMARCVCAVPSLSLLRCVYFVICNLFNTPACSTLAYPLRRAAKELKRIYLFFILFLFSIVKFMTNWCAGFSIHLPCRTVQQSEEKQ